MAHHRVDDRARRQGRACVVEVQDVGDAGRVGSQKRNVEHHRLVLVLTALFAISTVPSLSWPFL
jgi:hypothetical protein